MVSVDYAGAGVGGKTPTPRAELGDLPSLAPFKKKHVQFCSSETSLRFPYTIWKATKSPFYLPKI